MTNHTKYALGLKQRLATFHSQWLADGAPQPQWVIDMEAHLADPRRPLSDLAQHALARKARMEARDAAQAILNAAE